MATPEKGKRTRKRLPPERRRSELVECATQIVAESGFKGLTFKAVADRCGMTAPAVMHYFSSTQSLLEAVLDHYTLVLRQRASLLIDDGYGARTCLDAVVRDVWGWPMCIRLYTHLSAESIDQGHAARGYLLARHQSAINAIVKLIGQDHPDPKWAAEAFYTVVDGLRLRWIRDPNLDAVAEWRRIADRLYADTALASGAPPGRTRFTRGTES